MLSQFIEHLFKDLEGYIEIRRFDREEKPLGSKWFKDPKKFLAYEVDHTVHNYVGISDRRGKKGGNAECLTAPYIWFDFDHTNADAVRYLLDVRGLPLPSFIVNSGHGIHVYYKLAQRADVKLIRSVLEQMVPILDEGGKKEDRLRADAACVNEERIMRLPGSMNVKGEPIKCEITEANDREYDLESHFIKPLGLVLDSGKAKTPAGSKGSTQRNTGGQDEQDPALAKLYTSSMACIDLIARGVGKGQRNFGLGKLTAHLKMIGETERGALKIIRAWNQYNNPPKPDRELESEFSTFWRGDWEYLGCKFSNPRLEEINKSLCPKRKCNYDKRGGSSLKGGLIIDNYLFRDDVYKEITGLDLAILAEITKFKDRGIGREHLAQLVDRHSKGKALAESIKRLRNHEFIKITEGIRKNGISDSFDINEGRANYGRGYTIANGAIGQVFIGKRLTDSEYKLYVLLESFRFGKDVIFPTRARLAATTGFKENSIRKILQSLEHKGYIIREYTRDHTGKSKLFIRFIF